jgi:hypothetical protein
MYLEEMNFIKEGFPPPAHWTQGDKRLALRVWNEYERVRREYHEQAREEE